MPQLNEIQAFRGFAALLVVLFHATIITREYFGYSFLRGFFLFGYSGVDFFFVLSGFIITYVHEKDLGRRQSLLPYLQKRWSRIYPIYWLVTLVILPVYFLIPGFGYGYETQLSVIIASLLLVPQEHYPVLGVAWSLCHEVWFYLLFGMAIWTGRRTAVGIWGLLLFASGAFYARSLTLSLNDEMAFPIRFFLSRYNLEFAAGCLCAYLVRRLRPKHPFAIRNIGLTLFLATATLDPFLRRVSEHHSVLTFGTASALTVFGSSASELAGSPRRAGLLQYLGDASYSIYLTHYLTLSLCSKILRATTLAYWMPQPLLVLLVVTAAIAIGCLVHSLIERRILAAFRRGRSSRATTLAS